MTFQTSSKSIKWNHILVQSVCLSVRPSYLLTMFPSSYHHEIFRSYYIWQKWRPYKRSRSKVKVTEINTQLSRFWIITPVWIHIWWWNDAQSLMLLRRGALLFFKAIRQISRSPPPGTRLIKSLILTQIGRFRTVTPVWIHQWLQNCAQSLKQHRRGALLFYNVIHQISRSHGTKIAEFDPNWAFPDCNSSLTWLWNDAQSLM